MSSKEGKTSGGGADLMSTAAQKSMDGADPKICAILKQLLAAAKQPPRTRIRLAIEDIYYLLDTAKETFKKLSPLVEIEAPVIICGDIHGQYSDLLRIFEIGAPPPDSQYLFLGDYVDRAEQSIETVCLMYCYKVLHPNRFHMLRGNHECASINRIYGFFDECKRNYNVKLWRAFCDVFEWMPVAGIVSERIFCSHGGISPHLENMDQIRRIQRPTPVPDEGLLCDLLWSDPEPDLRGWADSDRGVSYVFGADVITKFLRTHDLDLMARAHQVVEDGYEFCANRQCVTIFSAPQYCGEFDNAAGMLIVNEDLVCSFKVLKSRYWRD